MKLFGWVATMHDDTRRRIHAAALGAALGYSRAHARMQTRHHETSHTLQNVAARIKGSKFTFSAAPLDRARSAFSASTLWYGLCQTRLGLFDHHRLLRCAACRLTFRCQSFNCCSHRAVFLTTFQASCFSLKVDAAAWS
jgi:hypothetical protein